MFENPMEMYDPYYVTSNKSPQREKKDYQKYSGNYNMEDKDLYSPMYENYLMDKNADAKYYNDYYKMSNDMYTMNDKNNDTMKNMDLIDKKNKDLNMSVDGDNILTYDYMSYLPEKPQMAMAYVPFQNKSRLYSSEDALNKGTLFEALYKPFKGRSVYRYE